MPPGLSCFAADRLSAYLQCRLTQPELMAIEQHLLVCTACLERTQELEARDPFFQAVAPEQGKALGPQVPVEDGRARAGVGAEFHGASASPDDQRTDRVKDPLYQPSPLPPTIVPPTVPGYEILGELGRGGMGVVYKARQVGLDRLVALKMILGWAHVRPDEVARFRIEAEAAARLQHPHIVQIYEIGVHEGLPYFSLELCSGGTLAAKLQGTPLPSREAAAHVETLARAMQAAHEQHIIHRDLKPANVLLSVAGTLKVTDFGLAKKLDAGPGQTKSGAVMGTPSYMAPEQAAGKTTEIGPAADVYALGAILYECLTGRPPFKAATSWDTIVQVITEEPPPPSRLNSRLPRELETICLKCLRKEPAKRYASAAELAEDLRRFQAGEPIAARPVGAATKMLKWVRRRPAAAALLAVSAAASLALLIGGLVYNYQLQVAYLLVEETQDEADRANRQATAFEAKARQTYEEAAGVRRSAEDDRQQAERALSDARQILYALQLQQVGAAADNRDYHQGLNLLEDAQRCPPSLREFTWGYYHRLCQRSRLTLSMSIDSAALALSPDSGTVAVGKGNAVELYNAVTGQRQATLPTDRGRVTAVAFSPRSDVLAAGTTLGSLVLWDLATGKSQPSWNACPFAVSCLAFSPDGKALAVGGAMGKSGVLKVWDVASRKELAACLGHTDMVLGVAFAPDGKTLATAGRDFTAKLWDANTGKERANLGGHTGHVNAVAFSRDGATLATGSADGLVKLWAVDTLQCRHSLNGLAAGVNGLAFAADGALAAGYDNACLKLWDGGSGKELALFRGHTERVRAVAASADGRTLASRTDDGAIKLWHADLAATATVVPGARGHCLAALADGKTVAFVGQDRAVHQYDLATGREHPRWAGFWRWFTALAASPNGQEMVTGSSDGSLRIWRVRDGHTVKIFLGHSSEITSLAYAPDGRILASTGRDKTVKLWDTATWTCRDTFRPEGGAGQLAFAPDGKTLAAAGNCLRLWDVVSGKELFGRSEFRGLVHAVAYSPDGQTVALGCGDRTVVLWDVGALKPRLVLAGHAGEVMSVVYSPDGRVLASAATDGTVLVWDTATLKQLAALRGHKGSVRRLAFTPDSRVLVSSGDDHVLRLWDGRPW